MMNVAKLVGEKFHQLRYKKGISQSEMSEVLNCSQRAISHWESGKRDIPLDKLMVICDYFKVEPNYFFPEKDDKSDKSDKDVLNIESSIEQRISNIEKSIEKIAQHVHVDVKNLPLVTANSIKNAHIANGNNSQITVSNINKKK